MYVKLPRYGFPARYNENHLALLVRDPHCLFAYWEFSEEQMNLVSREYGCPWGEVPLFLRVYDLTGLNFDGDNAHSYCDIKVHPLADNHYIKEVDGNHSYCVDIGVFTAEGRFVTLLRSNLVHTPRDSMADGSGVIWADLLDRLTGLKPKGVIETESFSSEGVYISSRVVENE